jgi:hypothetical protein
LASAYAYIYQATSQSVSSGSAFVFATNGVMSGISHTAGTSQITVGSAGIYSIAFAGVLQSITGGATLQLYRNGTPIFAGVNFSTVFAWSVLISLNASDVITLVNTSSLLAVTCPDVEITLQLVG